MKPDQRTELKRWMAEQIKAVLRNPPTEAEREFEKWKLTQDPAHLGHLTLLVKTTDDGWTEAFNIKITEVR